MKASKMEEIVKQSEKEVPAYNWDYLKIIREERGFTLRDVENISGVSNAYLSQLESGKIRRPSVQTIYTLSKVYGVDAETMLLAIGVLKQPDIEERVTMLDRLNDLEKRVKQLESKISLSHDRY